MNDEEFTMRRYPSQSSLKIIYLEGLMMSENLLRFCDLPPKDGWKSKIQNIYFRITQIFMLNFY